MTLGSDGSFLTRMVAGDALFALPLTTMQESDLMRRLRSIGIVLDLNAPYESLENSTVDSPVAGTGYSVALWTCLGAALLNGVLGVSIFLMMKRYSVKGKQSHLWLFKYKYQPGHSSPFWTPNLAVFLVLQSVLETIILVPYIIVCVLTYDGKHPTLTHKGGSFSWHTALWGVPYIGLFLSCISTLYSVWFAPIDHSRPVSKTSRILRPCVLNTVMAAVPVLTAVYVIVVAALIQQNVDKMGKAFAQLRTVLTATFRAWEESSRAGVTYEMSSIQQAAVDNVILDVEDSVARVRVLIRGMFIGWFILGLILLTVFVPVFTIILARLHHQYKVLQKWQARTGAESYPGLTHSTSPTQHETSSCSPSMPIGQTTLTSEQPAAMSLRKHPRRSSAASSFIEKASIDTDFLEASELSRHDTVDIPREAESRRTSERAFGEYDVTGGIRRSVSVTSVANYSTRRIASSSTRSFSVEVERSPSVVLVRPAKAARTIAKETRISEEAKEGWPVEEERDDLYQTTVEDFRQMQLERLRTYIRTVAFQFAYVTLVIAVILSESAYIIAGNRRQLKPLHARFIVLATTVWLYVALSMVNNAVMLVRFRHAITKKRPSDGRRMLLGSPTAKSPHLMGAVASIRMDVETVVTEQMATEHERDLHETVQALLFEDIDLRCTESPEQALQAWRQQRQGSKSDPMTARPPISTPVSPAKGPPAASTKSAIWPFAEENEMRQFEGNP